MASMLIAVSWLLLPVVSMFTLPSSALAGDDPESIVAGRLGGILQTFIDLYGDPVSVNESAGPLFSVEGFGYFSVQVDRIQGTHGARDRARVITVSSPRPLELPSLANHPADWSIEDGIKRVTSLLPRDADLSEFAPTDSGELTATCRSEALEEIFGVLTLGQCRINLVRPTPDTVSFATLTLTAGAAIGESITPAPDPCAGAVEWIKAAGDRLAESRALLETIGGIDETDPASVAVLTGIGSSFRELAAELRATPPPDATAQANYFLIAAFKTYADAMELAAVGLAERDSAKIDSALEQLDTANALVAQATIEIQHAADVCSLELGTPVAMDAGAASPVPGGDD